MPLYLMTLVDEDQRLTFKGDHVDVTEDGEEVGCCGHTPTCCITPCIVRAKDEDHARTIMYDDYDAYMNSDRGDEGFLNETDRDAWLTGELTCCTLLEEDGPMGIVHDSRLYYG